MEARVLELTASTWISTGREVTFPWKRDTSCPETSTNISSCLTSLNWATYSAESQCWWPRGHRPIAYVYWGTAPRAVQTGLLKQEGGEFSSAKSVFFQQVWEVDVGEATHQSLLQPTRPSKVVPKVLLSPLWGPATLSHRFHMLLTSQCIHFIVNKNLPYGWLFSAGRVFPQHLEQWLAF